MKNTQTHSNDV